MSSDFPPNQNDRPELEANLTALLLGELPADKAAALHEAMAHDQELGKLYERLKSTIQLVRETAASPATETVEQSAPLKLSTDRREKLLAQFKTVAPKEFAHPQKRRPAFRLRVLELAAVVAILAILVAMLLPALSSGKSKSRTVAVMHNLVQLDGAKQQWALEKHASPDAVPTLSDIMPYMGRGSGEPPKPLLGETYVIGKVSEAPVAVIRKGGKQTRLSLDGGGWKPVAQDGAAFAFSTQLKGGPIPAEPGQLDFTAKANLDQMATLGLQDKNQIPPESLHYQVALPAMNGSFDDLGPLPSRTSTGHGYADETINGDTHGHGSDNGRGKQIEFAGIANGAQSLSLPPPAKPGEVSSSPVYTRPTAATSSRETLNYRIVLPSAGSSESVAKPVATPEPIAASETPALAAPSNDSIGGASGGGGNRGDAAKGLADANYALTEKLKQKEPPLSRSPDLGLVESTNAILPFQTDQITGFNPGPPYAWQYGRDSQTAQSASAPPSGKIVLPSPYQSIATTSPPFATPATGDPEWVGLLNHPEVTHSSTNAFVAHNAFVATPPDRQTIPMQYANSVDVAPALRSLEGREAGVDPATGLPLGPLPTEAPVLSTTNYQVSADTLSLGLERLNERQPNAALAQVPAESQAVDFETAFQDHRRATTNSFAFYANLNGASDQAAPAQEATVVGGQPGEQYKANVVGYVNVPMQSANTNDLTWVPIAPTVSGIDDFRAKSTATLDRDGKFLFEGEKQDEAEAKLEQASKEDPQNRGAIAEKKDVDSLRKSDLSGRQGLTQIAKTTSQPAFAGPATEGKQLQMAKADLERVEKFRDVLAQRAQQENIDTAMPKTSQITVVNPAEVKPEQSPTLGQRIKQAVTGKVERFARVKAERDATDISGVQGGEITDGTVRRDATGSSYDPYFVSTELETLQSEPVLDKAIEKLKLNEAWSTKSGGESLTMPETRALLRKRLDLRAESKNSNVLDIGVKSGSPEEAAKIANAVAEAYAEHRAEERRELTLHGIKEFEGKLAEYDQKVARAKEEVAQLEKDSNGPGSTLGQVNVQRYNSLKIDNEAQFLKEAQLLERLKEIQSTNPALLRQTLPTVAPDSILNELLHDKASAEEKLVTQSNDLGDQNPEVQHRRKLVQELDSRIDERVNGIMAGLELQVASNRAVMSNAVKQVEQEKKRAMDLAQLQQNPGVQPPPTPKDEDRPIHRPAAPVAEPQPEVQTSSNAFSTFSMNVSDVSLKLAAASLEKGVMPDAASVRSEEFLNAFDYRDPEPPEGVPVGFAWDRAQYPFAQNRDLLRFSIKTAAQGRQAGCPMNIVLLLDNSGSMERADRVQIIHEALRVLAGQLQPQDKLSVVVFARTARLLVDGVAGDQAAQVAGEVSGLTPQGGTNLEEAMNLAYQTALRHYLARGVNRVVLLTDGAANLGNVEPEALKQKVEANRKQGVALDCFGIGWEGYNDDLLEVLSSHGDGRNAFLNTPEEAATDFAAKLAGALHVAANDVKVQVEFNPRRVNSYRQTGYAKHQLTKEQFRDNTVDAGEMAAAESGNALYVVEVNPHGEGPLATVRVRYKVPGTTDYPEHEWEVPFTATAAPLEHSSPAMRLAATASAFSEWLVSSPYAVEVTPDRLLGLLSGVPEIYGVDERPKKLEWMIRQAKSLEGK